jgi:DNA-directed RNA polymerase subunit alpha
MPKRLGKFELPNKLTKVEEGATPTYAKFIAEPLRPVMATPSAIRSAVFFSAPIEGSAISSIKIDGVSHEFRVHRQRRRGCHRYRAQSKENPHRLHEARSDHPPHQGNREAGPVTAADIQADANITIINPDQVICTLDTKPQLRSRDRDQDRPRLLSWVENKKEEQAIGVIPIDSLFSPVRLVKYCRRSDARRPDHRLRQAHP